MTEGTHYQPLPAEVIVVHLLLPDKVAIKYNKICKKFTKVFLLNHTVQKHQIILVNDFLSVKILTARPVLERIPVTSDSIYLVVPATRIRFMREANLPSKNRIQSTQMKVISAKADSGGNDETTSKGSAAFNHENEEVPYVRDTYPDKTRLIAHLEHKVIAEKKLIRSLVDSIISGLTTENIQCQGNNVRDCTSISSTTGVILQSVIGGGKTTLLEALHEVYGANRSCLFRSKELVGKNR